MKLMVIGSPIGSGIGSPLHTEEAQLSPKAIPPLVEHELYKTLLRTRKFLEEGAKDASVQIASLPKLVKDFDDVNFTSIRQKLGGGMNPSEATNVVNGNLSLKTTTAAVEILEEMALAQMAKAELSFPRIVRIDGSSVRQVVEDVISALTDLEECLNRDNEPKSDEYGLTELQRRLLISALEQMIAQLKGPTADRWQVGDLGKLLKAAFKDAVKKKISDRVSGLMDSAQKKVTSLGTELSSDDLESAASMIDFYSA